MHSNNPVIQLCIQGTQAEFQGQLAQAHALYQQAWQAAQDDYEGCIAAHYLARHQENPQDKLHWNQVALNKANAVQDGRMQQFYPSLFLNMGESYELLGNHEAAQQYYELAAQLGVVHRPGYTQQRPDRA
jgi:tetratricopeptide (TPR) repeat protein